MKNIRLVELFAWSGFALCVASLGVVKLQVHAANRAADDALFSKALPGALSGSQGEVIALRTKLHVQDVLGRLEVASIHLSVPILRGYEASTLRRGVGHIDGTAMPGGLGNMALAGHRDTFFKPLQNIRKGMTMSVVTPDGRYDYVVDSTAVVSPENVRVVSIHNVPEMTLITCYPFVFVGSAPQRFIVTAHLESLEPTDR